MLDLHLILNEKKRKEQRLLKELELVREGIKNYKAKIKWTAKQGEKI